LSPKRPPRACRHPGCWELAWNPSGFCTDHRSDPEKAKDWWTKLYNNRKWKARSKRFRYKHPDCKECGGPAEVVDHVVPHRGDLELFWDMSNWQSLCKKCHGKKSDSEVRH
jgi:5-methylcytosine-specific restriction protein A